MGIQKWGYQTHWGNRAISWWLDRQIPFLRQAPGGRKIVVAALQAAASPCPRAIDCCSHAHAKSLHALWPIRAPTLPPAPIRTRPSSCGNQDAWDVVTPNRPKANSRTFRRVTLKHARLTQQHVKGCTFCNTTLRPHYLSLATVPFSLLGSTTNQFKITVNATVLCSAKYHIDIIRKSNVSASRPTSVILIGTSRRLTLITVGVVFFTLSYTRPNQ